MKKVIAILCALFLVFTVVSVVSFADFGDFGGDADFGDGGGGYDGGDWDDDGYSSSGVLSSGSPFEVVVVIIAVIAFIIYAAVKSKGGNKSGYINVGNRETPQDQLRPMAEYRTVDPDFDEAALSELISNLYVRMQNCWTAGDLSMLRPYFTDALVTQFERQLKQKTAQGLVNHIDRISVQNVTLRGFRQENNTDHIIAKVETRIVDYTVEKSTGKIVSGSNTAEKFMTYEWDMSRTTGFATLKKDGVGRVFCPNCGAPLDVNVSARCEYCGGVITNSDHDWAIAKITGLSQKTI